MISKLEEAEAAVMEGVSGGVTVSHVHAPSRGLATTAVVVTTAIQPQPGLVQVAAEGMGDGVVLHFTPPPPAVPSPPSLPPSMPVGTSCGLPG